MAIKRQELNTLLSLLIVALYFFYILSLNDNSIISLYNSLHVISVFIQISLTFLNDNFE